MQDFTAEIPKVLKEEEAGEVNRILGRLRQSGLKDADIQALIDVLKTSKESKSRSKSAVQRPTFKSRTRFIRNSSVKLRHPPQTASLHSSNKSSPQTTTFALTGI